VKYLLLPIIFINTVFAQELVPLREEFTLKNRNVISEQFNKGPQGIDTLTLPFIDDFSTSKFKPNPLLFNDTGGIYINNRYCVNPPTFNVASFDGLDNKGQPYSESNEFDRGKCDELTSSPINLEGQTDVYMTFWWQAQGNAVPQVSTDSIHLLFYNNDRTWNLA